MKGFQRELDLCEGVSAGFLQGKLQARAQAQLEAEHRETRSTLPLQEAPPAAPLTCRPHAREFNFQISSG